MKPTLVLLVGPCGSGKTTYAMERLKEDFTLNRVSQDDLGKKHLDQFKLLIENKQSILIDRMGFSKEQRERYLKPAREAGYNTEIVVFHVPRQTCFDRIMARENHPTINGFDPSYGGGRAGNIMSELDEEIHRLDELAREHQHKTKQANSALDTFFTKYERVEDTEADKVTRLGWDGPKKTAIGSDLDGTLCNIEHRLHHVQNENRKLRRWDLFNKEIVNDSLNIWCADILEVYNRENYYPVILCSGRDDSNRRNTEEWLKKHNVRYDHLFMRHRSDFRDDTIIKQQIYEFEIKPLYDLLFVLDDRPKVVRKWREMGVTCLACNDKEF